MLVALGAIAFTACMRAVEAVGRPLPRPRPRFAHGAVYSLGGYRMLASYHPSQQNTFTGKLTPAMLRAVLRKAARLAASSREDARPAGTVT